MSTSTITRTALIKGNGVTLQRVAAFLPSNYEVWGWDDTGTAVVVKGHDNAGWTLDDYVLPRLASGCLFGTEVTWAPTHRSLDDGSEIMKVDDPGYGDGTVTFLAENENGDRDEYLASEWAPITEVTS